MRSLFSRVPDCGGNVVTGTQVHNQVSDTTSRKMTTIYRCKFDAFSFGTIKFEEGQERALH